MNNISEALSSTFRRTKLVIKKNSPEILIVAGVIGLVTSTVMACKASRNIDKVAEESKNIINEAHFRAQTEDDIIARKDIAVAYVKASAHIIKPYIPAATVGVASVACILTSNSISRNRNAALAGLLASNTNRFEKYRNYIKEKYGEEADTDALFNMHHQKFDKIEIDEKTGKEKKSKENVKVCDHDIPNTAYDRFFDETCPNFKKFPGANEAFINGQEKFANNVLRRDGYLMLNDVYDLLGVDRSEIGYQVGWVFDPEHPDKIDFGLRTINRMRSQDFLDGYEKSVVLSFNVDGYILDKIHIRKT